MRVGIRVGDGGQKPSHLAEHAFLAKAFISAKVEQASVKRFVRSVRAECLEHFVAFGERHLRHLLAEFTEHCHPERYHQGLDGKLIHPDPAPANDNGARPGNSVPRSPWRLAQLLNFYFRDAA